VRYFEKYDNMATLFGKTFLGKMFFAI